MADERRYRTGDFSTRIKDIQQGYGHRGLKLFLEGILYDQLWGELQQFQDNPIHFWLSVKSISTLEGLIKVDVYVYPDTFFADLELPDGWRVEVEVKEIGQ